MSVQGNQHTGRNKPTVYIFESVQCSPSRGITIWLNLYVEYLDVFTFENVNFNSFGFRIWRYELENSIIRFIHSLDEQRTHGDSGTPMLIENQSNVAAIIAFRPFWHINKLKIYLI